MLGAREKDLPVLSEIHRQERVHIAFVYDRDRTAVGMEIAEILGISRYQRPQDLGGMRDLDYIIVSEPRARFAAELEALAESGAKILNPGDAIKVLAGKEAEPATMGSEGKGQYTIEDTLAALEKLLDRGELLKFLLEVAVRATGARAGSVMFYSSETKELYIAYATGLSERVIKATRQKLGEGIAGTVALNKQAQLIRRPPKAALYARDRERDQLGSAISVPLLWSGELLGVLNVSSGKKDAPHTDRDLRRLSDLSRRFSRVLFESQKLQEVQMRHRESRFRMTMGEIAEKDIESREKFSVLSRYLGELMGADTVEIFVNTAEGDWLVLGGSSRMLSPTDKRIRYRNGALSRAFLEERCIVLTESADPSDDQLSPLSSAVYCHLSLKEIGGVVALEFSERTKLDEFMLVKDGIVTEISRFVGSEMRERHLRRKLGAMSRISDAAPALLGCSTVDDLGNVLAHVVGDVLECDRVSIRLRRSREDETLKESFLSRPGESVDVWREDDEKQFARLSEGREQFSIALLDFEGDEEPARAHSLLASPIEMDKELYGGIIAASKHPTDPLEESVFTELDQALIDNVTRLILPVLEGIYKHEVAPAPGEVEGYETLLEGNVERFQKFCDSEILRSNRYHHTFAVILFRIKPLENLFEDDHKTALGLVDEITQGIRTRTRKTDYGCWIDTMTYAMLTLEGGNRIRFLLSRAMMYLNKDLAEFITEPGEDDVQIGVSTYPGTARRATDLLEEAAKDLKPHSD